MAEEKKAGFPTIPSANWFLLRDKFKQKLPSEVSPNYIASALGMNEKSAGANVIPALKTLGIIDEAGKLTELAYDWREDTKYKEVCQKIVNSVYPETLRDVFHDSNSASIDALKSWFMRTAKVGEAAAIKYARTYNMLLGGEIASQKENSNISGNLKSKTKPPQKKPTKSLASADELPVEDGVKVAPVNNTFSPSLHIDIQIHISPESSAEQIDKIFESMSKHLKGFKS